MTAIVDQSTVTPVRKSITVHATVEHAFRVFTEEFDSWWPRSHHIGKSPMKRAIVEGDPAAVVIPSRRMAPTATGARSWSGSRRIVS